MKVEKMFMVVAYDWNGYPCFGKGKTEDQAWENVCRALTGEDGISPPDPEWEPVTVAEVKTTNVGVSWRSYRIHPATRLSDGGESILHPVGHPPTMLGGYDSHINARYGKGKVLVDGPRGIQFHHTADCRLG